MTMIKSDFYSNIKPLQKKINANFSREEYLSVENLSVTNISWNWIKVVAEIPQYGPVRPYVPMKIMQIQYLPFYRIQSTAEFGMRIIAEEVVN